MKTRRNVYLSLYAKRKPNSISNSLKDVSKISDFKNDTFSLSEIYPYKSTLSWYNDDFFNKSLYYMMKNHIYYHSYYNEKTMSNDCIMIPNLSFDMYTQLYTHDDYILDELIYNE